MRVYTVSPTTLYAHLQVILLSFEGKKIESKSREVFAMIRALKVDYEKVDENLGVLGRHIGNSSTQFNNVISSFQKIGKKLDTTKNLDFETDQKLLDQ
jgi:DNA recombination protein RmuC